MIYNDWHKNRINGLNKRLAAYTLVVQDILENLNKEACRIAGRTSYGVDSDKPFSFDDYPQTKAAVERLKQQYVSDLRTFITSNTAKEWRNSNVVQDLLINKVYSECNAKIDGVKRKHLYQTNPEALKAFQTRRINQQGTLSTTLWNQSNDYLDELEKTIGTAIKKGTSAITLSKQVSKYLANFSKLKADYKQMYGKADDIHDCEWRAARLARSEINMAYRTAEQTRWQQMDFVLGYEIRLSKTHGAEDADICDDLAGRYPKDFVWTGWHPNDKCYSVPILMDEDDFVRWNNGEPVNAKPIDDVPQAFKDWVKGNAADIQKKTKDGGSLPYFVKDNKAIIRELMPKINVEKSQLVLSKQNAPKYGFNGLKLSRKASAEARKILDEHTEVHNYSELQEQNFADIARVAGFKRGNPMTFSEADNGLSNVANDRENCAACVLSHEMRLRGFNVTALPYNSEPNSVSHKLADDTNSVWLTRKLKTPEITFIGGNEKEMLNMLEKQTQGYGSRYHLGWNDSLGGGHIITLERTKNGLVFYDAQKNEGLNFDFIYSQMKKDSKLELLRVDRLLIKPELLTQLLVEL